MNQTSPVQQIEMGLITFGTVLFQSIFFFLEDIHQSLIVSFLHYAIFIVGLYVFLFIAKPKGIYRLMFFMFVLMSLLFYLVFNKCILTHIELQLSDKKNAIQQTIETFFGSQIEGNKSSKTTLSVLSVLVGFFLVRDYTSKD